MRNVSTVEKTEETHSYTIEEKQNQLHIEEEIVNFN